MRQAERSATQAPLRVLIADDEQPIRLMVRVNLEVDGIDVIEAEDGERAVELALADPPDAAILDIFMPALDGWQVAESLRAHTATAGVPIIFLTAMTSLEYERRARAAGAWFVAKPFDPLRLPTIVRDAVAQSM
jgi:DNA-binding response OmpR family regulator